MRWRYNASFLSQSGMLSSKTSIPCSPITTSRCSLNGCSQLEVTCPAMPEGKRIWQMHQSAMPGVTYDAPCAVTVRSEEHTSELQSLMRISYAVFCLKKKKKTKQINDT